MYEQNWHWLNLFIHIIYTANHKKLINGLLISKSVEGQVGQLIDIWLNNKLKINNAMEQLQCKYCAFYQLNG